MFVRTDGSLAAGGRESAAAAAALGLQLPPFARGVVGPMDHCMDQRLDLGSVFGAVEILVKTGCSRR